MDFLAAALAEKAEKLNKRKATLGEAGAPKKFLKRSELKERGVLDEDLDKKVKTQEEIDAEIKAAEDETMEQRARRAKTAETPLEELEDTAAPEVKRRLRLLAEPITLFGESDAERLIRLKQVELRHHEKAEGSSEGRKNVLQNILQKEVEDEILAASLAALDQTQMDDEELAKQEKQKAKALKRAARYENFRERPAFDSDGDFVLFFFKKLLKTWETDLETRDADEKKSSKGKIASATQKQTRQYIKPLLQKLKEDTVEPDVMKNLVKIASNCIIREYVKANEAYLMLAIGNAAWPMGVTMVGIHERAGRERIFSQQVAHVLNNETQRKFIQATKRLMTYCQHKYPTVPSKMVN